MLYTGPTTTVDVLLQISNQIHEINISLIFIFAISMIVLFITRITK